jgi:hypothetical protein
MKCDRDAARIWAGCMWFLLNNQDKLIEALSRGYFDRQQSVLELPNQLAELEHPKVALGVMDLLNSPVERCCNARDAPITTRIRHLNLNHGIEDLPTRIQC